MGCLVQRYKDELKKAIPEVDLFVVELPLLVLDVLLELLWLELLLEPLFVVELLLLELICLVVLEVLLEALWCVWFKESEPVGPL